MGVINKQDLLQLKLREHEFLNLVETCSRDELAKCAKFLAMYVALYRQEFGDIPAAGYQKLLHTVTLDVEMLKIVADGMSEAAEMLKTVLLHTRGTSNETADDISYLN
jgi:hypothetical protein